jgi:superfamily I DNA and/or RNA helicase
MRRLLEVPESVRKALEIGQDFIGRSLRGETTEEILDELEEEDLDLPALCSRAMGFVTMFQTLLEAELQRQARRPAAKRIAKRLNLQHRMDPAIAEIVSHCFYDDGQGELKTHPDAKTRFRDTAAPFTSTAPERLPASPVVVIEMPSVQGTPHLKRQELFPRWTNPTEVEAVVTALSLLKADAGQPTLAVLSPYAQQVNLLRNRIADQRSGLLSNLACFKPATPSGEFAHTVDSFQGSEADVIVVSLVRNNDHSGLRNALGFLADPRRMNVLLSRARWQLILVGSLQFLREVVTVAKSGDEADAVDFLSRLLDAIDRGQESGKVALVPVHKLLGTAS